MRINAFAFFLLSTSIRSTFSLSIFYFIQIHNQRTADDAQHLLEAIFKEGQTSVLIHVDQKSSHLVSDFTRWTGLSRNIQVDSICSVEWSKWSMNEPTLWALERAVMHSDDWDVWINLSGDSYPVYTSLEHLPPYNYVTSSSCATGLVPTSVYEFPDWWHKRKHYTRSETMEPPSFDGVEISTYFGSQWMILQRDFCEWLVTNLHRSSSLASKYRQYLQNSGFLMTDETFIPSLLMATEWKDTLPVVNEEGALVWKGVATNIRHVRYERMDEHSPSAFGDFPMTQRYQVPAQLNSTVDIPRSWGPYYLGVYDLHDIRESGALFIRKVSTQMDGINLRRLLPVERHEQIPDIDWPEYVAVSDKPQWKQDLIDLFEDMKREEREIARKAARATQVANEDESSGEL